MSLLSQEPTDTTIEAAPGESYTKGSSHLVVAGIIAVVLVTVAVAIYVVTGEKPPASTGEVLDVWAHPMHTESSGFDASGAVIPKESIDQVLVFAHVRLHNQAKHRIFLHQILTNITLEDGLHSSYAAMPSDYERIFKAYPSLAQWHATTLSPDTTIEPGETKEGTFVSSFRLSKQQWEAQKNLNFSFAFQYLPSLTLTPTVQLTEH